MTSSQPSAASVAVEYINGASSSRRGVYHLYAAAARAKQAPLVDLDTFAELLFAHRRSHPEDINRPVAGPVNSDHLLPSSPYASLLDQPRGGLPPLPSSSPVAASLSTPTSFDARLQRAVVDLDLGTLSMLLAELQEAKFKDPALRDPAFLKVAKYLSAKLMQDANTRLDNADADLSSAREMVRVEKKQSSERREGTPPAPASTPAAARTLGPESLIAFGDSDRSPNSDESPAARSMRAYPPHSLPIGVVACCRASALDGALKSLLQVKGISKDRPQITVYQDGRDSSVADVARKHSEKVGHVFNNIPDTITDGAKRIAAHYKFTLSHLFDQNPDAPFVIVVEDDMVFAPDFLEYFSQLAYLYNEDSSVYCITSWNDNGQIGLVNDTRAVYRTEFFVGLGWLVSRSIFKNEWEHGWPVTHWDHWLREPNQRKGRECIYPEVSRNYNVGVLGTHSDQKLFDKFFKNIVLNSEYPAPLGDTDRVKEREYEHQLTALLQRAVVLNSIKEIEEKDYRGRVLVAYYQATGPEDTIWEKDIAPAFGLWHSVPHIRGAHKGLVRFRWRSNVMVLVASYSPYMRYKPEGSRLMHKKEFGKSFTDLPRHYSVVKAPQQTSCQKACSDKGLRCDVAALEYINNCEALQAHFDCKGGCHYNIGSDQPIWVSERKASNYGECLMNTGPFSCDGSHPITSRLCACA